MCECVCECVSGCVSGWGVCLEKSTKLCFTNGTLYNTAILHCNITIRQYCNTTITNYLYSHRYCFNVEVVNFFFLGGGEWIWYFGQ